MTTIEMLQEAKENECVYVATTDTIVKAKIKIKYTRSRGFFAENPKYNKNDPTLLDSNVLPEYFTKLIDNVEWVIERPKRMTLDEVNKIFLSHFGFKVEII